MRFSGLFPYVLVLLIACAGCREQPAAASKPPPPAKVEGSVKEADLVKVRLTPDAERHLGIQTAAAERKPVPRTRIIGGELMVPPGRDLSISAPISGTLLAPSEAGRPLEPGMRVRRGQVLFRLSPVMAGEHEVLSSSDRLSLARNQADLAALRVEAEGEVKSAAARLEAARQKAARAEQLRRDNLVSVQALEEAQTELKTAESQMAAAQARLDVLRDIKLDSRPEAVPSLAIDAPLDGVIRAVHVAAGLEVNAGTALFEVVSTDPLWVRVPVYVGDLELLDTTGEARLTLPSAPPDLPGTVVKPIHAAPSADPITVTVDLFYEVPNSDGRLRPAERVAVILPVRQPTESLVVPWSAVVFDIHGGSWVYVNPEPQVYIRKRVEVREAVGELAILARGPDPGTKVVAVGTAELFGTEFGVGK